MDGGFVVGAGARTISALDEENDNGLRLAGALRANGSSQYMERLSRDQPGYTRNVAIGPDSERWAPYRPIREVFERLE